MFCELFLNRKRIQNPSMVHDKFNIKNANCNMLIDEMRIVIEAECILLAIEEIMYKVENRAISGKKVQKNRKHMNSC